MPSLCIIILEATSLSIRGQVNRWMQEVAAGVYIGVLTKMVRDLIWEYVKLHLGTGRGVLIRQTDSELGFVIEYCNYQDRYVRDFDGVPLVTKKNIDPFWNRFNERSMQTDFLHNLETKNQVDNETVSFGCKEKIRDTPLENTIKSKSGSNNPNLLNACPNMDKMSIELSDSQSFMEEQGTEPRLPTDIEFENKQELGLSFIDYMNSLVFDWGSECSGSTPKQNFEFPKPSKSVEEIIASAFELDASFECIDHPVINHPIPALTDRYYHRIGDKANQIEGFASSHSKIPDEAKTNQEFSSSNLSELQPNKSKSSKKGKFASSKLIPVVYTAKNSILCDEPLGFLKDLKMPMNIIEKGFRAFIDIAGTSPVDVRFSDKKSNSLLQESDWSSLERNELEELLTKFGVRTRKQTHDSSHAVGSFALLGFALSETTHQPMQGMGYTPILSICLLNINEQAKGVNQNTNASSFDKRLQGSSKKQKTREKTQKESSMNNGKYIELCFYQIINLERNKQLNPYYFKAIGALMEFGTKFIVVEKQKIESNLSYMIAEHKIPIALTLPIIDIVNPRQSYRNIEDSLLSELGISRTISCDSEYSSYYNSFREHPDIFSKPITQISNHNMYRCLIPLFRYLLDSYK